MSMQIKLYYPQMEPLTCKPSDEMAEIIPEQSGTGLTLAVQSMRLAAGPVLL